MLAIGALSITLASVVGPFLNKTWRDDEHGYSLRGRLPSLGLHKLRSHSADRCGAICHPITVVTHLMRAERQALVAQMAGRSVALRRLLLIQTA